MTLGNLRQGLHLLSGAVECGEGLTWQIALILHEHPTLKQTLLRVQQQEQLITLTFAFRATPRSKFGSQWPHRGNLTPCQNYAEFM